MNLYIPERPAPPAPKVKRSEPIDYRNMEAQDPGPAGHKRAVSDYATVQRKWLEWQKFAALRRGTSRSGSAVMDQR